MFKKDEWKPGEKAVYLKNPKYKPRSRAALRRWPAARSSRSTASNGSGFPTRRRQVNALLNGEVDLVEIVPPDLLPLLQKDKNIKVRGDQRLGPPVRDALQRAAPSRSTTPRCARPCSLP